MDRLGRQDCCVIMYHYVLLGAQRVVFSVFFSLSLTTLFIFYRLELLITFAIKLYSFLHFMPVRHSERREERDHEAFFTPSSNTCFPLNTSSFWCSSGLTVLTAVQPTVSFNPHSVLQT